MSGVAVPEFAQPGWLWLLAALPLLWLLRWRGGVAESRFKLIGGTVLRTLALTALVIALAGPLAGSYSRYTDVVFALDVSRSIDRETTTDALNFINRANAAKPVGARTGLMVFGADAAVETLVRDDNEPVMNISAYVERGGTDIGHALEVAIAAFPTGQQRRIVLLSDGRENLGNARTVAAAARSIGVEIIAIPLDQSRRQDEVRVQNIAAPSQVREHEPFEVQMTLHSSKATRAHLVMLRNGSVLQQRDIELAAGANALSLIEQVDSSGLYEYEVIINSADDGEQENNRYQAFVQVKGAARVLHASGRPGWGRQVTAALQAQGLTVDDIPGTALPTGLHELADYDLVILNNVSGFDLSLAKMELLEDYVRDAGGGLLSLGGDNSYAAGGYYGTPVEQVLPVTMDLKSEVKIPSLAVVIVLDKSGSMASQSQGETKLSIAKRAALASIELLNSLDRVGILAFDSRQEWSVPPTEAANRQAIAEKLATLNVGGGTDLFRALREAQRVMVQQEARVKHLIVLSDGLTDDDADFDELGRRIAADGITVSTVALGEDADLTLMENIATLGRGRFYHTEDPQNIPRIFTSETLVVARNLVVEEETLPQLLYPGEMLSGFGAADDQNVFPPLLGYQRTFAKPAAQVLLSAPAGDPLLVSWRYGLGKSVAFMSDFSGRWGRHWLSWDQFSRFIAQAARWTMRQSGSESLLPTFRWQGRQGEIIIDALDHDDRFINGLELTGGVIDPDGNKTGITLQQIAPGRYKGEFEVPRTGRYYVNLSGSAQGSDIQVGPVTFGLAVPYSSEYVELGADPDFLKELAMTTGGKLLPLEASSLEAVTASKPGEISERWRIWRPFFLAALLLLLAEVAVRKITLPESWLDGWYRLRRRRRQALDDEPDYEALRAGIAQVREQHLRDLRDDSDIRRTDLDANPAARARLYLAGIRNKGR